METLTGLFGKLAGTDGEHIGERDYEDDDGYVRGMWDRWHPRLQTSVHRAMGVDFPPGHPANDTSLPMHERARAALEHVTKRGLGMHWTDDPEYGRKHLQTRLMPGETPVVVHAQTPPRHHVEDNGWVSEDRAIRDWDTEEREVPVKRNAPLNITGITWGKNHHDFAEPISKRAASDETVRMVPPEEYRQFHFPDYPNAKTLPALVKHFKKSDAEYYDKIKRDIQENGFTTPALVRYKDGGGRPLKKPQLMAGHHRAAVAHDLGIPLPVGDYDNHADFDRSNRGNAAWFRNDPRGGLSPVTAAYEHGTDSEGHQVELHPQDGWRHLDGSVIHDNGRTVSDGKVTPEIHRAMTIVLPKDKHDFVHDEGQPVAARAHMLLSEIKRQTPDIKNERLKGGTGGLGEFWSPREDKAREFTNGWEAYRAHERQHDCGDESGDHGCPTTRVVIHAEEPHHEHLWTDVYRNGERYDRELSWRMPLKPDTPLKVSGMSWGEGDDHKPILDQKPGGADLQRYDFASPVHKRAGANGDLPEGLTFEHREYPRSFEHKITARHPDLPEHPGYGRNYAGHITWFGDDPSGGDNREVSSIDVHPSLQRRGLATELYNRAKVITPDIHHSDTRTADGRAWSATTAAYQHEHDWLPSGHYWGPNSPHPDQRLFDGDKLRPEIRQDILSRVGSWFDKHGYSGWQEWAKVYFAGSEAAKWVDPDGTGNGDFDILIGIHWPVFREEHPEAADKNDLQVATAMTDGLWKEANVNGYYFTLADGRRVGPFDRTFFCNPLAWDIRKIHPYAAYDVTDDRWAVHPLKVPADWSAEKLPESYWDYAEAMGHAVQAIGQLPPEERARMARNLWEEIHTHRSDAFADGGHGLFDLSNVTEKYLSSHPDGLWDKLRAWKRDAPGSITQEAAVRNNSKDSDPDGADYQGVMIALVPPKEVCEDLAVEGGEPVDAMHVTLAYLGGKDENEPEDLTRLPRLVKAWAASQKPLTAHVGGVGTFVHPDQHVLWAAIDLPHGTVFRDDLVRMLEEHGYPVRHDHGWTPHVTISYGKSHFRFMPKIDPASWDVTEVWCCVGGRWESFPIGVES